MYARDFWYTRWSLVFRHSGVQGRDISSERTSKVSISTFKYIAFPPGILRSWRIEVLPVLFELFRQDISWANSSVQVHSGRTCIVDVRKGHSSFKRQEYAILYIFQCSFNLIVAEKPACICLLWDVPLPLIGSANFELLRATLGTRKGWDFVYPERRKRIHCCVFSSKRNSIFFY